MSMCGSIVCSGGSSEAVRMLPASTVRAVPPPPSLLGIQPSAAQKAPKSSGVRTGRPRSSTAPCRLSSPPLPSSLPTSRAQANTSVVPASSVASRTSGKPALVGGLIVSGSSVDSPEGSAARPRTGTGRASPYTARTQPVTARTTATLRTLRRLRTPTCRRIKVEKRSSSDSRREIT
ncbi:hypothetical protein T492DRAFT_840375 [Pavlovales sp. CCMP2436]|nr:hypothetical protein T492DRAFT_840375 [Pavlovales sp. CCMP2436]